MTVLLIINNIDAAIMVYSIFSAMTKTKNGHISFYGTSTVIIKSGIDLQICVVMPFLRKTGMVLEICSTAFFT